MCIFSCNTVLYKGPLYDVLFGQLVLCLYMSRMIGEDLFVLCSPGAVDGYCSYGISDLLLPHWLFELDQGLCKSFFIGGVNCKVPLVPYGLPPVFCPFTLKKQMIKVLNYFIVGSTIQFYNLVSKSQ